jgi:chloramphenicol 3-O-phosphotransferase
MSTTPHPTKTDNADQVKDSLYGAVKDEVGFEVNQIAGTGKAVDPNHSDVLVQKHVTGVSISLFALILIILLAIIGGIAIYTHSHKAPATPEHVGVLHPPLSESARAHSRLAMRAAIGNGLVRADDIAVR